MKTQVTIEVTYDDLSDECKRRIEQFKKEGHQVSIKWPENCDACSWLKRRDWDDGIVINDLAPDRMVLKDPQSVPEQNLKFGRAPEVKC